MRFAIAPLIVGAALAGCRQDNQDARRDLAELRKEVDALRTQAGRSGTAPAQPRAQSARPPRPDPSKVYAVGVDGAPAVGPAGAPVTIVMAYEYACPWCFRQREPFASVRQAYGDDVRIVYKPYVVHEDAAGDAALAACAGHRQGRFTEVSDALWSQVFERRAFDRASVERAASSVAGIDVARLRSDMDGDCKGWLEHERAGLVELGMYATPQLWINGRPIVGYKTFEQLKPLIDEELARARERIAAGTPSDAYYAQWVLKNGLRGLERVN